VTPLFYSLDVFHIVVVPSDARSTDFAWLYYYYPLLLRIIIGSDRRPETKQGLEGKIVRFRSERVRDGIRVRDKDRGSEAINFGAC